MNARKRAQVPVKSLTCILEKGSAEERAAAAIVLGALALGTPEVERALIRCLNAVPMAEKPYFMDALARQQGAAGLAAIVPFLGATGALREQAVRLVPRFGARAVPAIVLAVRQAARRGATVEEGAFIRALANTGAPEAFEFLAELLATGDFARSKRIYIALRSAARTWSAPTRAHASRAITGLLSDGSVDGNRTAEIAALKILRALPHGSAVPVLLVRLDGDREPVIRSNAIHALHAQTITRVNRERVRRALEPLLFEPDVRRIAGPAFCVLKRQQPPLLGQDLLQRMTALPRGPLRDEAVRLCAANGSRVLA